MIIIYINDIYIRFTLTITPLASNISPYHVIYVFSYVCSAPDVINIWEIGLLYLVVVEVLGDSFAIYQFRT